MRRAAACLVLLGPLLAAGCGDMARQPKQKTYDPPTLLSVMPGSTVEFEYTPPPPPAMSLALLERGQQRYRIYCAPCHSELGDGAGMIVQRGFPSPPSFHIARLREAPPQYFYDVMTRGRGSMYAFADRIDPMDRWAIAAYIRALQRSQNASFADVDANHRGALQ